MFTSYIKSQMNNDKTEEQKNFFLWILRSLKLKKLKRGKTNKENCMKLFFFPASQSHFYCCMKRYLSWWNIYHMVIYACTKTSVHNDNSKWILNLFFVYCWGWFVIHIIRQLSVIQIGIQFYKVWCWYGEKLP
jgi:hypothetical protein